MDIRNRKELHASATGLAGHPGGKRTALIYISISCAMSLVLMLLDMALSHQISNTGGLGSMSLRSALTTAQTILPVIQTLTMLCLGLGYRIAMLDLYRHRTTQPHTLKEGFRRLGPVIRFTLFQSLLYIGLGVAAFYVSCYAFIFLPLSDRFVELAEPMLAEMGSLDGLITMDEATALAMGEAMMPVFWIFGILFLLLFLPTFYSYRMGSYCLCEDPVPGAFASLRKSRAIMRRNRLALLRLDLDLWWYYLLQVLIFAVSMTGTILELFGLVLPWVVIYLVFPILSLGLQFCLYYFCMNRVTLVYAAAYDSLCPKQAPASGGVTLGNIFDLYRESNVYRESQER